MSDSRNSQASELIQLLHGIADDQARRDYDLCEQCESQELHYKTHVFLKIRIPIPPLANPRSALLHPFYPGDWKQMPPLSSPDIESIRELERITHFDSVELEGLWEQYKSLASAEDGIDGIDKSGFEACLGPLGLEGNVIVDRTFQWFDQDNNKLINFREFVCGLSVLWKGTLSEKIDFAFKGYDINDDKAISKLGLRTVIKACSEISRIMLSSVINIISPSPFEQYSSLSHDSSSSFDSSSNEVDSSPFDTQFDFIPSLERMTISGIDEIVETLFSKIDERGKGHIDYEDFCEYAKKDSSLVDWYSALGT
ncbi:8171_t:CDS:2 [Paraglomus brasilianum]|uniref:8171_t:CDS:1 n=1 Tax=Paraglomus brasilianum TaxID=144538 RepID=A0A9N9G909_9GLOM|nr:8171_t:CDS:2 [Paraglomus brasilianum]